MFETVFLKSQKGFPLKKFSFKFYCARFQEYQLIEHETLLFIGLLQNSKEINAISIFINIKYLLYAFIIYTKD